ncbi:hypothetical protein NJ7G_0059 [Natrinema sp. J7-2]|nr:hypothetical protein NJ7G_0059 [Natrinema sp. J7-2]
MFALLALADALKIDASAALEAAIEKYDRRLDGNETPGSGE